MTTPERSLRSLAAVAGFRSLSEMCREAQVGRATVSHGLRGGPIGRGTIAGLAIACGVSYEVVASIFAGVVRDGEYADNGESDDEATP